MNAYRRLILLSGLLTFVVIVLGAYVRLSDAGLGCPDWPGCYGQATPAQAVQYIATAETAAPHGPVTLGKAWKEMTHRYFASTLGLLIVTIAIIAWKKRVRLGQSPALASTIVALVVFQGLLGMWTVTLLLKPAIVTAHLLGGLTTLALLTWLTLRQYQADFGRRIIAAPLTRLIAAAGLAVLAGQIALGGWVSANYAALACTDFPLCQGTLIPRMDFANAFHVVRELGMTAQGALLSLEALTAIHWAHRSGALITVAALVLLAWRLYQHTTTRSLALIVLAMLTLQVLIGVANVYFSLPLALAVAHNGAAALLVVALVVVNFRLHHAGTHAEHAAQLPQTAAAAR